MRLVPFVRLLALGLLFFCVACGSTREITSPNRPSFANPRIIERSEHSQCVPYARAISGIKIYGDAADWWDLALDRYRRSGRPAPGSVIVLDGYSNPKRGHVAVVRRVVSAREIVVDHANWHNRGEIGLDQPVLDVSPRNDWSSVRVWYSPAGQYGTRIYRARGFILPANDSVAELDAPYTDDSVCRFLNTNS